MLICHRLYIFFIYLSIYLAIYLSIYIVYRAPWPSLEGSKTLTIKNSLYKTRSPRDPPDTVIKSAIPASSPPYPPFPPRATTTRYTKLPLFHSSGGKCLSRRPLVSSFTHHHHHHHDHYLLSPLHHHHITCNNILQQSVGIRKSASQCLSIIILLPLLLCMQSSHSSLFICRNTYYSLCISLFPSLPSFSPSFLLSLPFITLRLHFLLPHCLLPYSPSFLPSYSPSSLPFS